MGSGSSKSKRRVISICGQQPLHPKKVSKGSVVCEQEERDEGQTSQATQSVLEMKDGRPPLIDPDLQLLDDILTESENCLSWQEPTCKGQKMTNLTHINSESLSQGQENQRQDKQVPRMREIKPELHPVSSRGEHTQRRLQNIGDSCSKTVPESRRIFDLENNNLPQQPHTSDHMEDPVVYDDTEEALMDSIEQEYSQFHPIHPM